MRFLEWTLPFTLQVDDLYIYIGGIDVTQPTPRWRCEKRDKSTGASVSAFDTDGVVETCNGESKRYFYVIQKAKSGAWGSDAIISGYYGLILNKGEHVVGFKETGNENEYLFMCEVEYFKCIGLLVKYEN